MSRSAGDVMRDVVERKAERPNLSALILATAIGLALSLLGSWAVASAAHHAATWWAGGSPGVAAWWAALLLVRAATARTSPTVRSAPKSETPAAELPVHVMGVGFGYALVGFVCWGSVWVLRLVSS